MELCTMTTNYFTGFYVHEGKKMEDLCQEMWWKYVIKKFKFFII